MTDGPAVLSFRTGDADLVARVVRRADGERPLTDVEVRLLRYLARHAGEAVAREDLLREVWGYHARVVSRTVDTAVYRLRTKIEVDPARPVHLRTVPGHGYVLVLERAPAGRAPPPAEELVGRDDALAQLRRLAAAAPLVTLLGPGGAGKTRLALAWAAAVGATVAPLEGRTTTDGLVRGIADALGLSAVDEPRALAAALARRGALALVLDDLDQGVGPAAALVGALLAAAPDLRLVATSREPLGLAAEQILPVGGLSEAAAFELLHRRSARPCDPRWHEPDAVRPLLAALDRLPLAIELAAGWSDVLSVADFAARLDRQLDLLAAVDRDRPARHRDLRGVVAASWALLPPDDRAALRGLAVFAGAFTLDEAEGVLDRADAALALRRLVRRSLAQVVPGGFRLYAAVRAFAAEQGLDPLALGRHRDHLARLGADAALARFDGPERRRALAEGARARADLWLALERAAAERHPAAVPIARVLAKLPGTAAERLAALERVIELPGPRWLLDLDRAALLRVIGRVGEARTVAAEALAGARAAGDLRAEVEALDLLGVLDRDRGDGAEARARFEAALAGAERLGDPTVAARVLVGLAWLDATEARTAEAEARYRAALDRLPSDQGDARAAALSNLANLYRETGRDPIPLYEQALALHQDAENRVGEAIVRGSLGAAHAERGSLDVARRCFDESIATFRAIGLRHAEAAFVANRSALSRLERRFAEARADLLAALPVMEEHGDRRMQAMVRGNLGEIALEEGRPAEAIPLLEAALALVRGSRTGRLSGVFSGALALALARTGDADGARAALAAAERTLGEGGFVEERARLCARRALVLGALGDPMGAAAALAEARALAPAAPSRFLAAALAEAAAGAQGS